MFGEQQNAPFLSIIVPVHDRERFVRRCLDSVLTQDMTGCEIIAIDDASSDRSVEVMQTYGNQIRLLRHSRNQGVVLARATGITHANGEWVIFLDSDDELIRGSLARIRQILLTVPSSIDCALFRCRWDNGRISPDPLPVHDILDYEAYLRFAEIDPDHLEFLTCVRIKSIAEMGLASNRFEDLFWFNFYKEHKSKVFPDVVRLYHQDADNQLTDRMLATSKDDIGLANSRADMMTQLLAVHGSAMRGFAPKLFQRYASALASLEFQLGRRIQGVQYSVQAIRTRPWRLRPWMVLILGSAGMVDLAKGMRSRLRSQLKT
ncbi:MAG: glycosyltransferase family 2 protein [Acetobacteraceae bacterium]